MSMTFGGFLSRGRIRASLVSGVSRFGFARFKLTLSETSEYKALSSLGLKQVRRMRLACSVLNLPPYSGGPSECASFF